MPPPPYSRAPASEPNHKRVADMTPEERLESLKEWAEEQKWVRPGEAGTLPFGPGGVRAMRAQSYAGPVRIVQAQYTAPIGPPSYDTVLNDKAKEASEASKSSGRLKKWLDKRRDKSS